MPGMRQGPDDPFAGNARFMGDAESLLRGAARRREDAGLPPIEIPAPAPVEDRVAALRKKLNIPDDMPMQMFKLGEMSKGATPPFAQSQNLDIPLKDTIQPFPQREMRNEEGSAGGRIEARQAAHRAERIVEFKSENPDAPEGFAEYQFDAREWVISVLDAYFPSTEWNDAERRYREVPAEKQFPGLEGRTIHERVMTESVYVKIIRAVYDRTIREGLPAATEEILVEETVKVLKTLPIEST